MRFAFVVHALLLVAPKGDCTGRCCVTTWTHVQYRRVVGACGDGRQFEYNAGEYDPDDKGDHVALPLTAALAGSVGGRMSESEVTAAATRVARQSNTTERWHAFRHISAPGCPAIPPQIASNLLTIGS